MRDERDIHQGDVYWVTVGETEIAHPQVVIQEDVINRSRVSSVVVCALTTNRERATWPGNILLEAGEANLPRQSVVEVAKVSAMEKSRLGAYIGSLSRQRVEQILSGLRFVQSLGKRGEGG
jgi:mRNA interferase MazF